MIRRILSATLESALLIIRPNLRMLTKSDYNRYRECPIHLWMHKHRADELGVKEPNDQLAWIFEQGNLVERQARLMFPDGQLVHGHTGEAQKQTRALIENGASTIFQATAISDGLFVMADVLRWNAESGAWDLFEVKSSTSVKKDHLYDVCFQRLAFRRAGYSIGSLFLIHVNSGYVRQGDIDPPAFLVTENITAEVDAVTPEAELEIEQARTVAAQVDVPARTLCTCSPKACPCPGYCYPDLPEYSIFNLTRLREAKAKRLYASGIRTLHDLPAEYQLSNAQTLQVQTARSGRSIVDIPAIRRLLSPLEYPLYFLDYESWNPALPMFDGYRPYQQMVFQFSLHTVSEPSAPETHTDCLVRDLREPSYEVVHRLAESIGPSGSVVVWNKSFEKSRNNEMAARFPQFGQFLSSLNGRIFDLMDVFRKLHYVHPAFQGSCSIKDVLPVLVPGLSYENISIRDGAAASLTWCRMLTDGNRASEREENCDHLRAYCRLDTLAMVEVFRHVASIANRSD